MKWETQRYQSNRYLDQYSGTTPLLQFQKSTESKNKSSGSEEQPESAAAFSI